MGLDLYRPNRLSGNIVDVVAGRIYPGTLELEEGKITRIVASDTPFENYLMPGFIDAHVHIESSMLAPSEFARLAVIHGTVATVSDPHEIANVLGAAGVRYMIAQGERTPFKFCFGAPSCVPATAFETAGAAIDADDIEGLLVDARVRYLSEVMNVPGVVQSDPALLAKLAVARRLRKSLDGHAPGVRGDLLRRYAQAGISTDHECFTLEEAQEKLALGMKVLIREGSAAKNFEVLHPLLHEHAARMMFCTDDMHPDDLLKGHIDRLVKRGLERGVDMMKLLRVACRNPVAHYGLNVGLLQAGDPADLLVVDHPESLTVLETYLDGQRVAERGKTLIGRSKVDIVNRFEAGPKEVADFAVKAKGGKLRVIEALDGQLITRELVASPKLEGGRAVSDTARDILKLAVVNRYEDAPPALAFVKNFGLKRGAIASSVAHDSHNVIAVGVKDEDLARAVNLVMGARGGLSLADGTKETLLPLPVAGLMSDGDAFEVAEHYATLDREAKALGSMLRAPYMTLSFMALLVIPALKLSDKGLFDGERFCFTDLFTAV
ncbi:MAG: adenine deaminase [Deinococcota bacterium]|nr:adenine deaminase [Deinococcota bacterium]